jgi:hypothetical protein
MPKKNASTIDDRARLWTFVVYPESTPANWRDILDELHIQWVESPLHDADINADGGEKKPHIHIALSFEGKKSYEQVLDVSASVNGTKKVEKVASMKGLVRYFVHMDNPEKTQYDRSLIIGHGGFDVIHLLKPTSATRYELLGEMMDWVKENDCTNFFVLSQYAFHVRKDDWFPLLTDNSAIFMREYIKSFRYYKMDMIN